MYKEYALGGWDLSGLSPSHRILKFEKNIREIDKKALEFQGKKTLLKNDIPSETFYEILGLYEDIVEDLSKISNYANLFFSSDTSNDEARALVAKMSDFNARMANRTLFFDLWWKKEVDEKNTVRLLDDSGQLENYLRRSRILAKYALSEPEEKIISIKDTTGIGFIRKLYDQYTERFVFHVTLDGEERGITKSELTALFHSSHPETRELAYRSLLEVYGKDEDVLGELYRSVVLDWRNEGLHLRGYRSPISIRNISNDIPDEAVETLLSECRKNRTLFQKYFEHKAKILGIDQLNRFHIYAPFDALSERVISFAGAVDIVLNALREFSPRLSNLARNVLERNHLDSEVRRGKRSGAFCATASPNITPYVLVNYTGRRRDVFTLAHELGHAIHSQLADDKSILVQQAPLPLAELASVFSEMMVMGKMLNEASDEERKGLIMMQMDSLYATIIRQAYFTIFEVEAHKKISKGATIRDLSKLYYGNLREQFGDAVEVDPAFKYEWTYVPHFYHSPFYTYAYSFGNLLAVSLYQQHRRDGDKFAARYIEILSSGGSKSPERLLKEKGIYLRSEEIWQNGFDYISERIDELRRLKESS